MACSEDERHLGPGLGLPPGVPVVRVIRTIYDTEGRPVEVQDTIAAADRHEFQHEVSMTGDRALQS